MGGEIGGSDESGGGVEDRGWGGRYVQLRGEYCHGRSGSCRELEKC